MGIRNLTRFVDERFVRWSQKCPVRGELVIDGCSLYYEFLRGMNNEYGGDYMSLEREIDNFFKTLKKCEIKPFLVFDGTIDPKKTDTLIARTHDKLETAVTLAEQASYSSDTHAPTSRNFSSSKDRILEPYLGSYVMSDTVKHILGEDCVFVSDGDADIDIASLAIHRRCPVLSNDSDFYIFPLQYGYIPYSRFYWSNPKNNVIQAEFYFYELFCEHFGICDSSLLALIPAIAGNDMMPQLDAQQRNKILPPDPECNSLIETIVMYAASFTTLEACICTLQQQELTDPTAIIENIQEAYNDYFFVPCRFCNPLDVLKTTLECENGSPLPEFVLKKFRIGEFSTFLIRILCEQEMYQITIEDISESWCQLVGVPVRRVIYGILCGNNAFITECQRGENPLRYDQIEIKSVTHVTYDDKKITLPSLESCGLKIEREYGKKVLFGILDVKEGDFKKIPTNYHLLLAITCYWYKHCTISKKDAILKAFLLNLQKPGIIQNTTSSSVCRGETRKHKKSSSTSAKPLFPVASFVHAIAQWQSLYHDIYCLNKLLQEPLILLPVSDFLECSSLHDYIEVVIKEGVKKVIQQNGLDRSVYLDYLSVTCPAEESIYFW